MNSGKKTILGISSSPRAGRNTEAALEAALDEAKKIQGIEVDTIYLREYKDIHDCIGCFACCNNVADKFHGEVLCPAYQKDGMEKIAEKLLQCSGLLLASPVYFGTVNSLMKRFMDRTEGFLRYSHSKYKYGLQHKVGGAIAVGGNRNGGEEFTIQTMHYFFHVHDMVVIGSGGEPTPGCYLGGGATTWPNDKGEKNAVLSDELGLESCKRIGRNIAETVNRIY